MAFGRLMFHSLGFVGGACSHACPTRDKRLNGLLGNELFEEYEGKPLASADVRGDDGRLGGLTIALALDKADVQVAWSEIVGAAEALPDSSTAARGRGCSRGFAS